MAKKRRRTKTQRQVQAGCYTCRRAWAGGNAQGVAARHHDSSGHPTWVKVAMKIQYGERIEDKRQTNLWART